jgi:hypothetical protein
MTTPDTVDSAPPDYDPKRYKRRCPEQYQIRERRSRAMLLRMAGISMLEIGLRLHADPTVNSTGESFVGGYGWRNWTTGNKPVLGVTLANTVSRDLREEMDRGEERLDDLREEFRELELRRLDAAQAALWQRVQQGNDWAVDRFLGIVDRRIKILGLEAPSRSEISMRGNVTIQQGALPEVDPAYASAVLDGIAELASAPGGRSAAEIAEANRPLQELEVVDAEVVEEDA